VIFLKLKHSGVRNAMWTPEFGTHVTPTQLFITASKCQSAAARSHNFIWMPIFSAGQSPAAWTLWSMVQIPLGQ